MLVLPVEMLGMDALHSSCMSWSHAIALDHHQSGYAAYEIWTLVNMIKGVNLMRV